ncbi:MAG: class I SAM-dependent methyltransferase [Pseudomonadales bacterium]|nr:class I SAM-dependent methyltransferase [Pseudomonadales bacterium]
MHTELQLLSEQLQQATENSLWCADENAYKLNHIQFKGLAITNRFDIYQHLQAQGIKAAFNNFDFSEVPNNIDQAIFRIAKEKAVNLHIILSCAKKLASNGKLYLFGSKNEGIKSLSKKIKEDMAATIITDKFKNQWQRLCISGIQETDTQWLASPYGQLQTLNVKDFSFNSQFGIFGWDKVDRGSELLMQCMASTLKPDKSSSILDLGCGYGYLSIKTRELGFTQIDATDNNAAAIEATQKNFNIHHIEGQVTADDCANNNHKKYDIILCNPPFHKGFDHHKDLSQQFMHAIHRLLKQDGYAYIVCNQFVGVEKLANNLFSSISTLLQADGFKVIALKR